jgi:hypothetical protein
MPSQPPASSTTVRLFAPTKQDDLSSHLHRQLVGWVALMLPILLVIIAELRPTKGLKPGAILDSVSAYYYTGAVAAFCGSLVALTAFFVTYRGYKGGRRDLQTAWIAGIASLLVAFFPTTAPVTALKPMWWAPWMSVVHHISAAVLFGCLIYFSLVLFRKSSTQGQLPADKKWRNYCYLLCGWGMLLCMLWALISGLLGGSIFLPETIALVLFAVSWLVKGRAGWTLMTIGRQTLHYVLHPQQFIPDVWGAVR